MADKIFKNKVLNQTFEAMDILSNVSVGTWQEDYLLTELEFERIKSDKSITFLWAHRIFLSTIGFGIIIAAKGISTWVNVPERISIVEWAALGIGVVVSIFIYIVGYIVDYFLPNNRKRVMKNIERHFDAAIKRRIAYRKTK